MNVVVDTNVIVSGLLSPEGPPGEIIDLILTEKVGLFYDSRILFEYEGVLSRPRLRINAQDVDIFLAHVRENGVLVALEPLDDSLPDPSDEIFLQAAIAGPAECLITGNLKDFPPAKRQGVLVLSPADFLGHYKSKRD